MKIAIGCDNLAVDLKKTVINYLKQQEKIQVEIIDLGVAGSNPVDYPDIAEKVAIEVSQGECDRVCPIRSKSIYGLERMPSAWL
jgi:ribose 5-phosphate isomerase B